MLRVGATETNKEITNAFNNFFIQIAENLNNKHINVYKALQLLKEAHPNKMTQMKIIWVTKMEMINTIKALKTKHSSGYDGIYEKKCKMLC